MTETPDTPEPATAAPAQKTPKPSAAQLIIELARPCVLFHGPDQTPYVQLRNGPDTPPFTVPLLGQEFRDHLIRSYYRATNKAPRQATVQEALAVLSAKARYDGPTKPVFCRLGGDDRRVLLHLCNPAFEVVAITGDGFKIISEADVPAVRHPGMLPLPRPIYNTQIQNLRSFVNVGSDEEFRLLVGWLLCCFRPSGPYPVLLLQGEQGTGKTLLTKMLRRLVDPNKAAARAQPTYPRDLFIAARNSRLVILENVSAIPQWLSDCLCQLATGGAYATRSLYTDTDEVLFDVQAPVILNGISEFCSSPDLLDRAIRIRLVSIADSARRPEADLWRQFEKLEPYFLGAMINLVSAAIGNLPKTQLKELPRMADAALWVSAAEPVLGWEPGTFIRDFSANRHEADASALDASVVFPPLQAVLGYCDWHGTATQLLAELNQHFAERGHPPRGWPASAQALRSHLDRLAPLLRRRGWEIVLPTQGGRSGRVIHLRGPDATRARP